MAKVKNPIISLSAKGSLGGSTTFQERHSLSIVRSKPLPSQPDTLPQIYQRWDFQYYIIQWHNLTQAQKNAYRPAASRNHSTPYAEFLRSQLAELPDMIGRWRLDKKADNVVLDTSKNSNHGIKFGASYVSALVAEGLYFDGVDDRITFTTKLNTPTGKFTVFQKYKTYTGFTADLPTISQYHQGNSQFRTGGWSIALYNGKVRPTIEDYLADATVEWVCPWGDNEWHSIAVTYDATTYKLYTDLTFRGQAIFSMELATTNFRIGERSDGWGNVKGTLDELYYFNRVLNTEELKLLEDRRYP